MEERLDVPDVAEIWLVDHGMGHWEAGAMETVSGAPTTNGFVVRMRGRLYAVVSEGVHATHYSDATQAVKNLFDEPIGVLFSEPTGEASNTRFVSVEEGGVGVDAATAAASVLVRTSWEEGPEVRVVVDGREVTFGVSFAKGEGGTFRPQISQ